MMERYRICPHGAHFKIQYWGRNSWGLGEERWRNLRQFFPLHSEIEVFDTEAVAKSFIDRRRDYAFRVEENSRRGCYEYPRPT